LPDELGGLLRGVNDHFEGHHDLLKREYQKGEENKRSIGSIVF